MTLPKKGFRTIKVNGDRFMWRVRKKISVVEEMGCPLVIPIQYEKGGQLLLINTDYHRLATIGNPNLIKSITPTWIEKCIKKAIIQGWCYRKDGKPMNITAKVLG